MYLKVLNFVLLLVGLALAKDFIDLLDPSDANINELPWNDGESSPYSRFNEFEANANDNRSHDGISKRQAPPPPAEQPRLLENKDYGACVTPSGEQGHCRHIIYCRIPDLKDDVWTLVSHLCIIEKSSIGVCCPESVLTRVGPQIIANSTEGAVRITNHPEQRGCGITTKQFPRITGGRPAEPDEWPWMVAILNRGLPHVWCGGVLVTDRHVLTAAHCVHKIIRDDVFVRLGEYNTQEKNETRARDFRIGSIVIHIDYNPLTYEHDIAIVRLERSTLYNTYIWPVCMPPINEAWEGRMGVVTGWGTQTFGGPHANVLMVVSLPIWKHSDCQNALVERVPHNTLCAGYPAGGQDSCQGDSGGPLLYQLPNRRWIIIGIVSWGLGCGEPNRPGIYTRVDKYLHWIIRNSDT